MYNYTSRTNGSTERTSSQGTIDGETADHVSKTSSDFKTTRTKDPMAFSSILSSSEPDRSVANSHSIPASKHLKTSNDKKGDAKPSTILSRKSTTHSMSPKDYPAQNKRSIKVETEPLFSTKTTGLNKGRPAITWDKEDEKIRKELAKIDAMELSEFEGPEFETAKQKYAKTLSKRQRGVEDTEDNKRKVKPKY